MQKLSQFQTRFTSAAISATAFNVNGRFAQSFLSIVALLAPFSIFAEETLNRVSLRAATGRSFLIYPDRSYQNEFDYSSGAYGEMGISYEFFSASRWGASVDAAFFSVPEISVVNVTTPFQKAGYSTFSPAALIGHKTQNVTFLTGIRSLATLSTVTRTRYETATDTTSTRDIYVDNRLSQTYPAWRIEIEFTNFFGIHAGFLDANANLQYGWLHFDFQFMFDPMHGVFPGFELLNHSSFGKGFPDFVRPPSAIFIGYVLRWDKFQLRFKPSFLLNATTEFQSRVITLPDRLNAELMLSLLW